MEWNPFDANELILAVESYNFHNIIFHFFLKENIFS